MICPPYEWPATTVGPVWRRSTWRRRATSAASEVSGNCGAVTVNPDACKDLITSLQLEPSAQAPWTSTTFGLSLMVKIVRAEPAASHESTDSFLNRLPGPQHVSQLGARGDLQLRKYSIQVAANGSRRHEKAFCDLTVRQTVGGELSDLELLRGQTIAEIGRTAPNLLSGSAQLVSRSPAPGGGAESIEQSNALPQRRP